MVNDGMMDRFGVQEVYGLHNMPGIPEGAFALRPGPMMAAADLFDITVEGLGGHAAHPDKCIDTTLVAAQILIALQSIVSRNVDPIENAVLSVTAFHTDGEAFNVIPQTVRMRGTVRTLSAKVQDLVEARMGRIVEGIAAAHGARAELHYHRNYPITANSVAETAFAAAVASEISGAANVDADTPPVMGGEDFSFMLNARPGAFVFLGQGDTASVHHPDYDFNDAIIPVGCSYWARLAETAMPV
jgi:hippurate hydrolase